MGGDRDVFGWGLPPGVTDRMIDEAYGLDGDQGDCPGCDGWGSVQEGPDHYRCSKCNGTGWVGDDWDHDSELKGE